MWTSPDFAYLVCGRTVRTPSALRRAFLDGGLDLLRHPGQVGGDRAEVRAEHDDQRHRRLRDDRGVPAVRLEQRDLAEEVARAECGKDRAVVGDLGGALLDHEELV